MRFKSPDFHVISSQSCGHDGSNEDDIVDVAHSSVSASSAVGISVFLTQSQQQLHVPKPPHDDDEYGEVTVCELNCEMIVASSADDPQWNRLTSLKGGHAPQVLTPPPSSKADRQKAPIMLNRPGNTTLNNERAVELLWEWLVNVIGKTKADATALVRVMRDRVVQHIPRLFMDMPRLMNWATDASTFSHLFATSPLGSAPVRTLVWHPHCLRLAIALVDDSVGVYDVESSLWIGEALYEEESQRNISVVAWKPFCSSVLAVGGSEGIVLWHIPSTVLSTSRKSLAQRVLLGRVDNEKESSVSMAAVTSSSLGRRMPWCVVLKYAGHVPIGGLSWSPNGRYLASTSPCDSGLLVWDVALEAPTLLRRLPFVGGLGLVSWAPNSSRLLTASASTPSMRLWDTSNWNSQCWNQLAGPLRTACWTPDGATLLFSSYESFYVYSLSFERLPKIQDQQHKPVTMTYSSDNVEKKATENQDVSFLVASLASVDVKEKMKIGGVIKAMVLCGASGERLAVIFDGDEPGTEIVALFRVEVDGNSVQLWSNGFVRGPPGSGKAQAINFAPFYEDGSLLAIAWQDGTIASIPLSYLSSKRVREDRYTLNE